MTEIHTGFSVSQGFYYLFIYIASPFVAIKSSQLVDCAFVCQTDEAFECHHQVQCSGMSQLCRDCHMC